MGGLEIGGSVAPPPSRFSTPPFDHQKRLKSKNSKISKCSKNSKYSKNSKCSKIENLEYTKL